MRYVLLALITIGMMTYAVIDCVRTEDSRIRLGLPHWFWVAIIILLPFAGALLWLIVAAVNRRKFEDGPATRPHRPRGPVAPDDDPDFLFRLERERRRAQQARDAAAGGAGRAPGTGTGPRGTGPATPGAAGGAGPAGAGSGSGDRGDSGPPPGRHGTGPHGDADEAGPGSAEEPPGPHREEPDAQDLLYVPEEFQDLPLPHDRPGAQQPGSPAEDDDAPAADDEGNLLDHPGAEDRADDDNNGRS